MPIDRAPWNALIDDDGSNLVGTVWNKDKIKTTILDPTDAAMVPGFFTPATVGTVNDWDPTGNSTLAMRPSTVMQWVGGAALTVTGIVAAPKCYLTIHNSASSPISFLHLNAASLAANRLANTVSSGPTQIASGGYVTYFHNGSNWVLIDHEQGSWITPPYSAADYTAQAGTWTVDAGDITVCRYRLSGKTLSLNLRVTTTSVSVTAGWLIRTIPGGFTSAGSLHTTASISNNGALYVPALVTFAAAGNVMNFWADLSGGGSWAPATNATSIFCNHATIEVN